jgi:DNA-binding PucR family transcriptional regulator
VLAELHGPEPWLVIPEPDLYLRDGQVRALLEACGGVIGPTVPPEQAGDSLRWARTLRARLPESGEGPVDGEAHLAALLLLADPALVRLIAARRLRALDELTPKQRRRLGDTLLAWLQSDRGSAPDVAARLGIHPQTARQRLHQVQRIFGPALADADARFELEIALRARED